MGDLHLFIATLCYTSKGHCGKIGPLQKSVHLLNSRPKRKQRATSDTAVGQQHRGLNVKTAQVLSKRRQWKLRRAILKRPIGHDDRMTVPGGEAGLAPASRAMPCTDMEAPGVLRVGRLRLPSLPIRICTVTLRRKTSVMSTTMAKMKTSRPSSRRFAEDPCQKRSRKRR
jgi:hypothetical protein